MTFIVQVAAGIVIAYISIIVLNIFVLVPLAKFLVTAVGVGI